MLTGKEPSPVTAVAFPLAIVFFIANLALWGIVVGRRLVQS